MKKQSLFLTLLLASIVSVSAFTGCSGGGSNETVATPTPTEETTGTPKEEQPKTETPDKATDESTDIYPLSGSPKLSYYVSLHPNIAATTASMGDTPFGKKWSEDTGVELEYVHPPQGQEAEFFNMMIASQDYPDIIDYAWFNYPGGVQKAFKDNVIIPLNDAFEQYSPAITNYIKENPALDKPIKTDDGQYFMYPQFQNDLRLSSVYGLVARGDWMDELGIEMPETIDQLYDMLVLFRDEKGATAPFTMSFTGEKFKYGILSGGFGVKNDYYIEGDKVVYGPLEPGFKEFLTEMNKWYNENLLDANFAVIDGTTVNAKMLNGESGVTFGYAGGTIGNLMSASEEEEFRLYGLPIMSTEKGKKPEFGSDGNLVMNSGVAISTLCKDVETAARFLDYGYTEEGNLLMNFGVEGESYTMVDGKPIYTDLIMKNPDGLTLSQAMVLYIRAAYSGPMNKDYGYQEQYQSLPEQQDAITTWSNTNKVDHLIPFISFTSEESNEVAKINNAANTLNEEMIIKFITGTESLDNFDTYTEQLKQLGVEKVIEYYEAAIARYNQR